MTDYYYDATTYRLDHYVDVGKSATFQVSPEESVGIDGGSFVQDSDLFGTVTDENGNTTDLTLGRLGEDNGMTDANGDVTTYTHDSMGNVTSTTTSNPSTSGGSTVTTSTTYNSGDKPTLIDYPDGTTETWEYDSTFDMPIQYKNRQGYITNYTLDPGTGRWHRNSGPLRHSRRFDE